MIAAIYARKSTEQNVSEDAKSVTRQVDNAMTYAAAKLRELEAKKNVLKMQVLGLHPVPRLAPELVESRLAEWRRLLRGSTTQGRAVLQRILRGRIVFTPRPDGTGYEFSAPTRFDKLFTGIIVPRPTWLAEGDSRGTEHVGPNDTFDADYGALLERVEGVASPPRANPLPGPAAENGKGLASPSGIEPESRP